MEKIIRTLKEMLEKEERQFIEYSLIVRASPIDSPIPDTQASLNNIADLNEAISILECHAMQKPMQKIKR